MSSGGIRFPVSKILIEWSCSFEHKTHPHYIVHLPIAYVLIEWSRASEHPKHICYIAHVPTTYILIEWKSILEHLLHVCHCRQVRGICSGDFQAATSCKGPLHTFPLDVTPLLDRLYFVRSFTTIEMNMRKISSDFHLVLSWDGIRVGRISGLISIRSTIPPIDRVVIRTTVAKGRDGNFFVIHCCLPSSDKRPCFIATIWIEYIPRDSPSPSDERCSGIHGLWAIGPVSNS